jgi:hypothetical protein
MTAGCTTGASFWAVLLGTNFTIKSLLRSSRSFSDFSIHCKVHSNFYLDGLLLNPSRFVRVCMFSMFYLNITIGALSKWQYIRPIKF